MLLWIAVVLPSLVLATDTNWQYQIYVSSSDGTNSSSCWNGSVPCNTLNLALQGVQHNSTVIYLYPGIYTLDDEVQVRNISRVEIIGLSNDVTISCQPLTGQWLDNIIFLCVTFYNCPTSIINSIPCPYNTISNATLYFYLCDNFIQPGGSIEFNAIVFDHFNNKRYIWTEGLKICIISGPDLAKMCSNKNKCVSIEWTNYNDDELFCNNNYYNYNYSICYYADSLETSTDLVIEIETMGSTVTASTNMTLSLVPCDSYYGHYQSLDIETGMCTDSADCAYYDNITIAPYCYFQCFKSYANYRCAANRTGRLCGSCEDGYSVPINLPTKCVQCDPLIARGWILFVTVQLLPVTVMVLLIIVLNIQLTSGSINALVFYSQILTTVYPGFTSMFGTFCSYCFTDSYIFLNKNCYQALPLIPLNIFNLDFTLFLNDYPLCISSANTPLGAISFWYVIGLYPLLLLLLLYVWVTLYDKGYKVIVLITRPIHRLLARFWRMTNIEPSLPHSIASIYLLCFMQLAATSFKLLHFQVYDGEFVFFYDGTFGWPHIFAGIFAILVLILLVLIPMLYIQLYPFKPFHKLLECLHLNNWQILTSLGDVFTGPYKNGTTNKLDYRYFAGFYLLLRIIILLLHFIPISQTNFPVGDMIYYIIQICVFGLFSGSVMIFRPYQKYLNNFFEFIIFLILVVCSLFLIYLRPMEVLLQLSFDCLVFGLIIPVYFIYWIVKKIRSCYGYCRDHRLLSSNTTYGAVNDTDQIDGTVDDSVWIADRMINPQDYDEQHIPVTPLQ